MQAKAKIDVKAGIVELEGSEEFVRENLERFSKLFRGLDSPTSTLNFSGEMKQERKTEEENSLKAKTTKSPKNAKTTKSKRVEPETWDLHEAGTVPSLEAFLAEKAPSKMADIIAVIAYYMREYKAINAFSDGQIEYALRTLQQQRPIHLRQSIIDAKNKKSFFEPDTLEGSKNWLLSRVGEIYVEKKLPEPSSK